MTRDDIAFKERVYALVGGIPKGHVMTYGQIAAQCGNARAARIVGGIAHYGDVELPWHRVVNRYGGLAKGYPGGRASHKQALAEEGITFVRKSGEDFVELEKYLWHI